MFFRAPSLSGSSILANYFWSSLNLVFQKGLRFWAIVICIRAAGPENWGYVAATFVTLGFLSLLADLGLSGVPQLFKVQDRSLDLPLFRRILISKAILALFGISSLQALNSLGFDLGRTVLAFSWVLLPRALTIEGWFHRREQYHLTQAIGSLKTGVFFLGVLIGVRPGADPMVIILLELFAEALGTVFGWGIWVWMGSHKAVREAAGKTAVPYSALFRLSLPLGLIAFLNALHQTVDILFLKHWVGAEAAGGYDAGYKIGSLYFLSGAILIQVLRPKFARLWQKQEIGAIATTLTHGARFLALLGTLLFLPSLFYADSLISFIYGDESGLTILVFRWAPLWVCISFMTMLCADTLLCLGRKRQYLTGAALCAAMNVVGNIGLIRIFGADGAIFATIFAEAVFLAYAFMRLPPEFQKAVYPPLLRLGLLLAGLLACYGFSLVATSSTLGFALSSGLLGLYVLLEKPVRREGLELIRRH